MEEIRGKNIEELLKEVERKYGATWYNTVHIDFLIDPKKGIIVRITPIEQWQAKDIDISDITEELIPENQEIEAILKEHKDPKVDVKVSDDNMVAYITIIPGIERKMPSFEEIMKLLHTNGIIFGINEEEIKKVIEKEIIFRSVIVASGVYPTEPVDARVEYKFPKDGIIELSAPEKNIIDPATRKKIFICKEGDILVEKKTPINGKPGKDVFGRKIPPSRKVKDISLNEMVGENVKLSESGCSIISLVEGQPYISDDGKVNVKELFVVNGDLDYSIGNIDFPGSVWIRGNIEGNFKVISGKDVIVDGLVSGGFHIEAKGSVIIRKGVFGRGKGKIIAGENISAKFLNEVLVMSGGYVEIGEYIMNSHVVSKKDVVVFKKGLILGGKISTSRNIRAKTLGSISGVKTILEAGIDFENRKRYYELSYELMKLISEITSLSAFQRKIEMMHSTSAEKDKKEIALILINIESRKINLYKEIKKRKQALEALKISEKEQQLSQNASIIASNMCHPGVIITIGDENIKVNDSLGSTVFKYDVLQKRIRAIPYKTWRSFLK